MMINPLNQLINKPFVYTMVYYRNPKAASSSLYSALGARNLFWREKKFLEEKLSKDKKYQGVFDVSHVLPEEARKLMGRGIENFFSFTCVRNPFDRQVSQWSFSRGKGWGRLYGLPDNGTFDEWCEILWRKRADKDFWPTILQIKFSHAVPLNCVLKFENLQKDWADMLKDNQITGLPNTLPWENKTNHPPYQDLITDRAAEIIREIFLDDFQKLGYNINL